jgi:hypothetical protein
MIEHRHPTASTQRHVLAASGNQCAFPSCSRLIFDLEHSTLVGTIAHIRARCENGPRFDSQQSEDENRSFENLMAMCAEHSKIIDGTNWKSFSIELLSAWKRDHEHEVACRADRSWIRIPNWIRTYQVDGAKLELSYWIDRTGRPRAFTAQQLATLNTLMQINMALFGLTGLHSGLHAAAKVNADVTTVLQQDWGKVKVEKSAMADICMLFAMAGNITFAEYLGFLCSGNDTSGLIAEAARRVQNIANGIDDPLVDKHFRSDRVQN